MVAVTDAWDPKRHDEIIVSTLPMRFSKWMHAGLPERISRLTGAPVTHVVAEPPKPPDADDRAAASRRVERGDGTAGGARLGRAKAALSALGSRSHGPRWAQPCDNPAQWP